MEIKDIVETAKEKLMEFTGFSSPNAIGINKEGNEWHITVEIIEKPSEAVNLEILGIYDVRVDASGNLLGYERMGMRKRGDIQKGDIRRE
ncbi:hypothetical protein AUJ66_00015 [Candidatus Desantisbacteria bacterium CG1_02_38_46]|uniref:Gas vesicle protein GvpR n=1 Tax=Candidatus Desantisbacteria bacterium CG1_02_38_46 TaxID=1817893 RepID=A0A1J4SJV4_9BACT|nr:MAG: hypothetical protein AUJ66_00015 [Candidatus Desantisbacteria bacterium CG1_02_38_46]